MQKCLKVIHISQSIFRRNKLDKCIKQVLDINITTNTANSLKIRYIIIVVPEKHTCHASITHSSAPKERKEKTRGKDKAKKKKKKGKDITLHL